MSFGKALLVVILGVVIAEKFVVPMVPSFGLGTK
jgi:hypothetical protein